MSLAKALQAAAGNAGAEATYIEDVFSTYLYTGNGSTQTITNGIDLAGEGGLVWIKRRNGVYNHVLYDTARGVNLSLSSNTTAGNVNQAPDGVSAFGATGFSLNGNSHLDNNTTGTYASWTFRKAEKFFDVVTYTGNGSAMTISHNLGAVPGCMIVKRTDSTGEWKVYHRSTGNGNELVLNSIGNSAATTSWNSTTPTSTSFYVDAPLNTNGATYVAYLFAHDAGGFGDDGSENVISCGSYTGTGVAGNTITLGYEPQWVMIKQTNDTSNWYMIDVMRGFPVGSADARLFANTTAVEDVSTIGNPTATGFSLDTAGFPNASGNTYIYIAIRRGPMKTPESGTSVFVPDASGNNIPSGGIAYNTTFPVDWFIQKGKASGTDGFAHTRLLGSTYLATNLTNAEAASGFTFDTNEGVKHSGFNFTDRCAWLFQRAPGFFDVVCYTGTGVARTVNHNLGVAPELMIVKQRSGSDSWKVYVSSLTAAYAITLNETTQKELQGSVLWNSTDPTSSVFSLGTGNASNANNTTLVAYLFATVPGVSKVFSYTGNGSSQTINCGFSGGARFVLIKRTDSTGDWYVWDTARGMVAANDPHLSLNNTAAEVTTDDSVDTASTGFIVNQVAATNVNVSSATYVGLAIA